MRMQLFAFRRSKSARRRYVKKMYDKLTSNNSFRFINPPLVQRSRRVREPQFDVKCLSRKKSNRVVQELDCLLGENENYEDFVRSTRYRELRVIVANTAWAMNNSFRSNVTRTNSSKDSLIRHAISRWKLRLSKSLGSPVDPEMTAAENTKTLSSILRGYTYKASDAPPIRNRPDLNVHFSSAASMVIFPINNTPSTSSSTVGQEQGIMGSLNKATAAFSTFITQESTCQAHVKKHDVLLPCDVSCPSSVDITYNVTEKVVPSQKINAEMLSTESSGSLDVHMDRNSDSQQNIPNEKPQQLITVTEDMKSSKSSEKRNTSRNEMPKCGKGSCCFQVVKRKLTSFVDEINSLNRESPPVSSMDDGASDEYFVYPCGEPAKVSARDSLSVIPNQKSKDIDHKNARVNHVT